MEIRARPYRVFLFYLKLRRRNGRKDRHVIDFLSKNWQLITFVLSCMVYMYRQVSATRKGIRALLRADLVRLYNKYHDDLKYCPLYVKQALEDEYKQYHILKGNGLGTKMYEALMELPTEPPEEKENNHGY